MENARTLNAQVDYSNNIITELNKLSDDINETRKSYVPVNKRDTLVQYILNDIYNKLIEIKYSEEKRLRELKTEIENDMRHMDAVAEDFYRALNK